MICFFKIVPVSALRFFKSHSKILCYYYYDDDDDVTIQPLSLQCSYGYKDFFLMRCSLTNTWFVCVQANQSIYFTVFVSPNLPVHVTNIARVDQVYEKHAGTTDILMVSIISYLIDLFQITSYRWLQ